MKQLRDSFIGRIKLEMEFAAGVFVVFKLGELKHKELAKKHPDSPIYIGTKDPGEPGNRMVSFRPRHRDVLENLEKNKFLTNEGFLSNLVQAWHDFLGNLSEEIFRAHLTGSMSYDLTAFQTAKITLSNIDQARSMESIVEQLVREFDFYASEDKLKAVRRALGKTMSESDISTIKKNVAVRNIIQHQAGIINEDHVSRLGSAYVESDEGDGIKKQLPGDRVQVTSYDLENFAKALQSCALVLVQ